jgi:hypothetical protein
VERDLEDSDAEALSADWRMQIAYNAALQAATAALVPSGYRAVREQHHYRVVHSLVLTLRAPAELVQALDGFRKKRNFSNYQRSGGVSDSEAKAMRELAETIKDAVITWLRERHPHLMRHVR